MIESLAEYDTKYQMKKMYDTICMILYIASRFFGKSGSMIQYVGYYIYYHLPHSGLSSEWPGASLVGVSES